MLDLSPTKILIVLVVAVLLLGPKRLPQLARQLGAGWRRLRTWYHQLDADLRHSVPNLPTSRDIVRFARSPMAVLDRLADLPEPAGEASSNGADPPGDDAPGQVLAGEHGVLADDPNLN